MQQYDVIVVGAGPGGLGACLRARELGLSVALIERRHQLSPLVRACSEGLLYDEVYNSDAAHIDSNSGRIGFLKNPFSFAYSGPIRKVPFFANISPAGHRMKIVRYDGEPIHMVYDKASFLEENLSAAVRAGTVFFPGSSVTAVETSRDTVKVTSDAGTISAGFLVAADGHNSKCAELAGFNTGRNSFATLSVACWHITGFEPDESAHIHLIEGKGGPATICFCPRALPGQYNVMISGFNPAANYEAIFERVRKCSVLSRHFTPDFKILRSLACVLKLRSPMENPCGRRIFITGDAAWIGQTSNTHAALCSTRAVECCAEALKNNLEEDTIYEPYRLWWKRYYINHYNTPGANFMEELTGEEIDELFVDMPEQIPGSLEPSMAKKLIGEFFKNYMPGVTAKNPKLAAKLAGIQQMSPDEAWRRRREG